MSPVSAIYWTIPGYLIFWLLFAIAFGLFIQRIYLLFCLLHLGQKEKRSERMGHRIKLVLVDFFLQWSSLKHTTINDLAGIGHAVMVWGFGLFIIGYIIFIGLGGGFGLSPMLSQFETIYFSILDIAGLFVILALVGAAIKRYMVKPERLKASTEAAGLALPLLLISMFTLILLHYCITGFGYAGYQVSASLPPIGAALASLLTEIGVAQGTLVAVYKGVWWLNYLIILGFLVYAPRSKHLHPLASLPNLLFKSLMAKGSLKPINLEEARNFGVSKIQHFTWKQLLDLYACTECGRCQVNCPAQLSGKVLSPGRMILNLKEHLLEAGPQLLKKTADRGLIGEVVTEDEIWGCTTCRACQEVCPVYNEHIDKIIDLRRNLVLEQASIPETADGALRSIEARGHPWPGTTATRTDWADGLGIKTLAEDSDIDILYWVGCTQALEDRSYEGVSSYR